MSDESNNKSIEDIFEEQWSIYLELYENYTDHRPFLRTDCTAYVNLILLFRELGYTKKFRPGSTMDALTISRSKTYGQGLTPPNPIILLFLKPYHRLEARYRNDDEYIVIETPSNEIIQDFNILLQKLLNHPIT